MLHLWNGFGENINNANNKFQYLQEGGILNKAEGQGNCFDNVNNTPLAYNVPLAQNDHFGGKIMGTVMTASMATITKTKTTTRTTLIKYQTMMKVIWNNIMILVIVTYLKLTMKIIITQKMRKMMIIILMNLKMMSKIQMILINLKILQVQTKEGTDVVVIIPYQAEKAG